MMPPPASSYQAIVGMQPTSSLALTGNQQSNMGNQIQGMMVQYPPMQSYQVFFASFFPFLINITSLDAKESFQNKSVRWVLMEEARVDF